MNFSVFMSPPASARPRRPYNCPEELRDVEAVRNVPLRTLKQKDCPRQALPLDIHFTTTSVEDDHIVYHAAMESIVTKHKWSVSYRYSEFLAFKVQIDELYTCHAIKCNGSCQAIRDYMAECFPKRRLLGSSSQRVIEDRKRKLETVLLHLLRCVLLPGSAMKCHRARRLLPTALFEFLGVANEQDRRSLLQIYVDNRSLAHSKRFSTSTITSSSRSFALSDCGSVAEDAASCASTWDDEHDEAQCAICLEDMDEEVSWSASDCGCDESSCEEPAHSTVTLPCHHAFHRECIFEWLLFEFHCPLCRARVGPNAVTNFCRPKGCAQWWLGEFEEDPLAKSD